MPNLTLEVGPRERVLRRFRGYLQVPADDVYRFALSSDDGSRLTIGERVVVDNDEYGAAEATGTIALAAVAGMRSWSILQLHRRHQARAGHGRGSAPLTPVASEHLSTRARAMIAAASSERSWRRLVRRSCDRALRLLGARDRLKRHNAHLIRRHARRRDLVLDSMPSTLQLEHSTYCNLRCRMCSIIRPSRNRALQHMSEELVLRLRPVLPYVREVSLNGGGEPFLVPRIDRFLDVFRSYGVRLATITNATLITERLGKLIGETFSHLIVSMDGATRATYEMIRENARFEHLLRGIDLVNQHRRKGLRLSLAFVAMRCNLPELPALIQFASEHQVQDVRVAWMVPFADLPWTHDQVPSLDPIAANGWLAEARAAAAALGVELQAPDPLPQVADPASHAPAAPDLEEPTAVYGKLLDASRVGGYCHLMYDKAMVLVDGRVKPCCHSHEIMGSVFTTPFAEIWNGPAYQHLRAGFASGVLPASCRSCNFLRSGQLKSGWLVAADAVT
ncbi:MAG: SPASM domain-containing protein [Planctomycetota bacterium]